MTAQRHALRFMVLLILAGSAACAGAADRLADRAGLATEREVGERIERGISGAADAAEEAVTEDAAGESETQSDPAGPSAGARATVSTAPGEGAWANYDFVPGDEIVFYDDYSNDEVGDFPRRLDLVKGSWEVVEWEGDRYLRATATGLVTIPLPSTLPDRFTIEFPMSLRHGNAYVRLTTGPAYQTRPTDYQGSAISVEATRAGIRPAGAGPNAMAQMEYRFGRDGVAPLRVMADGEYMKVYIGERRIANVPNAVVPRSDMLYLAVSSASQRSPIMIGPIRVAAGGRDLYDRLERDGRVATQGILFATGSDRIRPESTPTLAEIGTMLGEHPGLRLSIEGHTDGDGDADYNQDLSDRRAASVKRVLVERYGIDGARLETAGFGESQPVADNASPEGKQQNRRVELVKLAGG